MARAGPKILILTYGTRGDVEPFLALAIGLRDAGYRVSLATAARFESWIRDHDIDAIALSDRSLDQMDSPDGHLLIEGKSPLWQRIAAGIRMYRGAGDFLPELNTQSWDAYQRVKPDLILFHPKMMGAPHIAAGTGTPAMMGLLQPMVVPTQAFPPTGMPNLPLPGWNRFSYRLVGLSYGTMGKPVNDLRRRVLGLPPVRGWRMLFPEDAGTIPVLHAISPTVLPPPEDWPDHAHVTGYWMLADAAQDYRPPEELARFLDAGPAPVYVGFGSMVSEDPTTLARLVAKALRKAGVRGVIGAGWAGLEMPASDDLIVIPPVPHRWLFPRMAAVVHHGGAGTTAQGFMAGVPCVICPFFGDQPGWAARSVALGVGAPPVPRKAMTASKLARSVRQAVTDPELQRNARTLGEAIASEDGIAKAVRLIDAEIAGP